MLRVQYGDLLNVPVCLLHVLLQGAVTLLAPGEGVVCRDLLPRLVAGERELLGVLVLKEALQVPLGQLGGVVQREAVEALLLFLHVALPERELQVADFGAAVCAAGADEAPEGSQDDDAPAQDLQACRLILGLKLKFVEIKTNDFFKSKICEPSHFSNCGWRC